MLQISFKNRMYSFTTKDGKQAVYRLELNEGKAPYCHAKWIITWYSNGSPYYTYQFADDTDMLAFFGELAMNAKLIQVTKEE